MNEKDINSYLTAEQKHEFIQDLLSVSKSGNLTMQGLAAKYGVDLETVNAWKDEVLSEADKKTEAVINDDTSALTGRKETVADKLSKLNRQGKFNSTKKTLRIAVFTLIIVAAGIIGLRVGVYFYNRPQPFDPFDYITVNYDGLDGYGSAEASFDVSKAGSALGKSLSQADINVSVDAKDGLKNGDLVTVKVSDSDSLHAKKLTSSVNEKSYTVEGLEEGTPVDAFKDITVQFGGMEGEGTAKVVNNSTDDFCKQLKYAVDPASGLSEGDTITVTVKANDSLVASTKKFPQETTETITVPELGKYAEDVSDISDNDLKAVADQDAKAMSALLIADKDHNFKDIYNLGLDAWNGGVVYSVTSFNLDSVYLVSDKTYDQYIEQNRGTTPIYPIRGNSDRRDDNDKNILFFIYKSTAHMDAYAGSEDSGVRYFWIAYSNALVQPDGTLDMNALKRKGDCVQEYGKSYASRQELEGDTISPYEIARYTVSSKPFAQ